MSGFKGVNFEFLVPAILQQPIEISFEYYVICFHFRQNNSASTIRKIRIDKFSEISATTDLDEFPYNFNTKTFIETSPMSKNRE